MGSVWEPMLPLYFHPVTTLVSEPLCGSWGLFAAKVWLVDVLGVLRRNPLT